MPVNNNGLFSDGIIGDGTQPYVRLGWLVVLGGVGGFLLWATFAPLDKGVPVFGVVEVATNRKEIQYQPGGVVESILVKDGDTVKAGQVLIRMNDTQTKAQVEITRTQYYFDLAVVARLRAELVRKRTINYPEELLAHRTDIRVKDDIDSQTQLLATHLLSLEIGISAIDESITGLELQINGLETARSSRLLQQQYLSEQIRGLKTLVSEGYVAKDRLLELQRNLAEVEGVLAEETGRLEYNKRQVVETKLKRAQYLADSQKEVRQQLSDAVREANMLRDRLSSQDFDLGLTEVKAPVAGIVENLRIWTPGGAVAPGMTMLEIVPSNDELIVDGRIPTELIDKIHQGLDVDMTFPAFNQNTTPHIPGQVVTVSADRLMDQNTGRSYYAMRAKVSGTGVRLVATLKLRPGMPVEIFVKTGSRTMMSYMFKPMLDRIRTSMREE
jgi:protease secretion system membrane fusion protein